MGFNRGGGPSGLPVRAGDFVLNLSGTKHGKVTNVTDQVGQDVVHVTWDDGTKGVYSQGQLQGTSF